ncbi:hypothetical protein A2803_02710 [Candidatus Woesebacteria bacterium RIFCSPHIGHO2_01_FULL_44_21]|uniref:Uncharacterized protein n=1 Tax=Candidatus Woesebacteria bacterium RIFCSPHIGHO2_01_FULL_44_21 TaxID=1802503 RepID=A0A1F7YXA0_9BACT|nr:MAG: hypothetical protein A2803_02710 [Candidatus Woesebacteria bacterium RIFCSPHIGHO2_01_FULL_44_21]OGM69816.1 MAG: hypothetical protein A2897_00535 [Candidatus Woesebacteria bacterium RIFCSPLOWO2_01_FULL_44_24b]
MKTFKLAIYLIALAVVPVVCLWFPFFSRTPEVLGVQIPEGGMQIIAANYDGPLYIAVAKSLYNLPYIAENFSFSLPLEYYAAHFPVYPMIIRLFASLVGYPWGMLLATLAGSTITIYYFYMFIKRYVSKKDALWLVAVFSIFPARWLIVRTVGSPEPLFVGAILASVYHFGKKQFWLAAIWGVVAQLTKSPGILLFIAYIGALIIPKLAGLATNHNFVKWVKSIEYKAYPIILIPLSLLSLFYFYYLKFGNFLAYFNSGDNIHLLFPPFQIFNYSQPWVNTHWLEEIIFVYVLCLFGLLKLIKKKQTVLAWFTGIFIVSVFFVSHRDIVRYALPILPFIFVAFSKELASREFKIIMAIIIIPVYLFSLAFIANNVMPISDWGPLL